ncbi:MAG TPA: hypothetical protein VFX70_05015 [Mycobacteriales bacterium]|nr:hypothetical protein [Mycobacteriales bacterium]
MLPRIAYSLSRAKALTAVTAVTVLGGALLFTGSAGASPGSAGPAVTSPSASASSGPVLSPAPTATAPTATAPAPTATAPTTPTATAPAPTATTAPTATATATSAPVQSPLIAVDGIAGEGFASGCILLKGFDRRLYQLDVPNTFTDDGWRPVVKIPFGVPVRVFATEAGRVASYCSGIMINVQGVSPLASR